MTVVRLKPKQTTVREGWQWTGQPREKWPMWVENSCKFLIGTNIVIYRRSGNVVVNLTEWIVRDLDSTDVIPYTEDELWKEFER